MAKKYKYKVFTFNNVDEDYLNYIRKELYKKDKYFQYVDMIFFYTVTAIY